MSQSAFSQAPPVKKNGTTRQQMLLLIASAELFAWLFFLPCPLCWQLPSEVQADVDDCCESATRAQLLFSTFPSNCCHLPAITAERPLEFSKPSRDSVGFMSKVCLTLKKTRPGCPGVPHDLSGANIVLKVLKM